MANELPRTLAVILADGALYERAPSELRERLKSRLHEVRAVDVEDRAAVQAPPISTAPEGAVAPVAPEAPIAPSAPVAPNAGVARNPRRFFGLLPDRRIGWSFAGGGFAGIALSVLLGVTVLPGVRWLGSSTAQSPSTLFEQQIVASHVRALMSSREMDVLSSDQHTVKPWFNGRIDYAPPVIDPRAAGFPLVGGRLDYVGDRPVAVMVYRYLKHPIDLYVFPDAGEGASGAPSSTGSAQHAMSKQGYSIIEWKHGGMIFWAITDASMPNLTSFVDAVRRSG